MATKYLRGAAWILDWTDPQTGRRQRLKIGSAPAFTESDAVTALKALEYELASSNPVLDLVRRRRRGEPWHETTKRYLEWHANEYPASHWRTALIFEKHLEPWFRDVTIDMVDEARTTKYLALRSKHVAPSTVCKELRTLKAMLNKAVEWKLLTQNTIAAVAAPRDLRSSPVLFYTSSELARLYQASSSRNAAVWKLFANTGLRRTEALNLRWSNVSDHAITVVSTTEARTKSARWRHIPISPGAREALDVLAREVAGSYGPGVLPRLTPHALTRAFARDLQRSNLSGSLHKLRHTFASHLVMAGRPLSEIKALLGHASITTTEIYAHLAPEHLQNAVKGMNL